MTQTPYSSSQDIVMKALHKHDLLGLLIIAVVATVIDYLSTARFGLMAGVGAATTVTVMEWLSRRKQRKLLPAIEAVADQALQLSRQLAAFGEPAIMAHAPQHEQAALRLKASAARAREQLF